MRVAALLVVVVLASGCSTVSEHLPGSVTEILDTGRRETAAEEYARDDSLRAVAWRERVREDSVRTAARLQHVADVRAQIREAEIAEAERVAAEGAPRRANWARSTAIHDASRGHTDVLVREATVLRDSAGPDANVLRELSEGDVVVAWSYDGQYWGIQLPGGLYGYVVGPAIEATPEQVDYVVHGPDLTPAEPEDSNPAAGGRARGSSRSSDAGRTYYRGARGGCYYVNAQGNREYVSRDRCR